jgi:cold shock CspA family protein
VPFEQLGEGMQVEFDPVTMEGKGLRAANVRVIKK